MEEGVAKGKAEGIVKVAKNLKALGVPIDYISIATDLTLCVSGGQRSGQ